MTSAPAEGVLSLIRTTVETSGWRVGVGPFTDTPDTQIVCVDGPGQESNPKWLLDYVIVQVLIRGAPQGGYQAAYGKARQAFDILLGMAPATVNGDRWDGITSLGGMPHFIGLDVNSRPLITANYRIIIEPAASAETHREAL